jgi:hypothetical protein
MRIKKAASLVKAALEQITALVVSGTEMISGHSI